jgi:hypothetical protein
MEISKRGRNGGEMLKNILDDLEWGIIKEDEAITKIKLGLTKILPGEEPETRSDNLWEEGQARGFNTCLELVKQIISEA